MIRPMAAADIPTAMQRSTGTRETRRRGGDGERMGWAAGLRGLRARPGARHCIAARRMAARQLASPIVSTPGRSGLGLPRCSVLVLGTLLSRASRGRRGYCSTACSAATAALLAWDVFSDHAAAPDLARRWGFAPRRRLIRMARSMRPGGSETPLGDRTMQFGIAAFEFGRPWASPNTLHLTILMRFSISGTLSDKIANTLSREAAAGI